MDNDGCGKIFQWIIYAIAAIVCILCSVAGVQSMGFIGIFIGPLVVLFGFFLISTIF